MFDWRRLFRIRRVPSAAAGYVRELLDTDWRTLPGETKNRWDQILRLIFRHEILLAPDQERKLDVWRRRLAQVWDDHPNAKESERFLMALGVEMERPEDSQRIEENALLASIWQRAEDARNSGARRAFDS